MKKRIVFCFLALLTGVGSVYADITIKAKVPAEWTNNIYVNLYNSGTANGWYNTEQVGDWYCFTYTGSETTINAIFVNNTESGKWPTNKNDQTTNVASVTADKCIVISYNSTASSKSSWANADCPVFYTFPAGTTIHYDFREYGSGFNIYNNAWQADASSIIHVTLAADWTFTIGSKLFRTGAGGWSDKLCTSLPEDGQNMIVSADGITYTWDTYVPPTTPSVSFVSLGSTIGQNTDVKFCAVSDNINGPGQPATSYKFYVKKGTGSYSLISAGHYQFAETGTYTVRVRAYDSENAQKAELEQSVEVIDANMLYYVKTNGWTQVNAHMWGADPSTVWPGAVMTLTNATTSRNNYPVYSVAFEPAYNKVIFSDNGDSQTDNMNLNTTTPYYYENEWYASLDDCDQPVLTTAFYLAGSFNSWSTTADRFMKAAEDATEASVTISVSEYSNITFKVVDNGGWCGATDGAITKDANTVTIAAAGSGANIAMTPYAAGDYIFTLNLNSRELTVTYPSGDPMPIPKNIYLSCDKLNEWASADPDYKFTVDVPNDIATLEVDLAATTDYAFKLVYNDAWMGANYDFKYYWCSDVKLFVDATQANLYSFKAGTYTFRYKLSTSELTIDFPNTSATSVAISSYEYATLYSDIAFDVPEEVEAYIITGNDGIKLTMERVWRIPAETGVLLHAAQGSYDFNEGDGRYMGVDVSANLMKGSVTDEEINNEAVHYVLSYDEDYRVGLFWPYGTGATNGVGAFTNGAGKAYLELNPQTNAGAPRRGFLFTAQEDTYTALDEVMPSSGNAKRLVNGQLFILHQGKIYNAQGARLR